jgi:ATP-dependent DNA ligase
MSFIRPMLCSRLSDLSRLATGLYVGEPKKRSSRPGVRADGAMSFAAFDVLETDGQMVMREPWRDRRKRLEVIFEDQSLPRVGLVPVTDDVAGLFELWVGGGGEGIVLKEPGPTTRRSPSSTASAPAPP